jgi:hypothetical protein
LSPYIVAAMIKIIWISIDLYFAYKFTLLSGWILIISRLRLKLSLRTFAHEKVIAQFIWWNIWKIERHSEKYFLKWCQL